jgi:hypothetical protein
MSDFHSIDSAFLLILGIGCSAIIASLQIVAINRTAKTPKEFLQYIEEEQPELVKSMAVYFLNRFWISFTLLLLAFILGILSLLLLLIIKGS